MFKWENIKLFLFPLNPIKVFLNIRLMVILSLLLALRFVLQYLTIYIPAASMSISIAWTPLMVAGWFFGPIFGFFLGFITDTISYLIKPGSIWFWMYAIQEPLVGLLSGIIGYIYLIRVKSIFKNNLVSKNKNLFKDPINKGYKIDLIIQQIFFILFLIGCVFVLFFWLDQTQSFESKSGFDSVFYDSSRYIIIGSLIFFFVVVELLTFFIYKKNKKNLMLCSWILVLVLLSSIIFSFVMGPISATGYYEYLNNKQSPSFLKYGAIFYLIPRVIKESIKVPIQTLLFLTVIPIAYKFLNEIKNTIRLKWQNENLYLNKLFNLKKDKVANDNIIEIATSSLIIGNKKVFLHHIINSSDGQILLAKIEDKLDANNYLKFVIEFFNSKSLFKEIVFSGELPLKFRYQIKKKLFSELKQLEIKTTIKKTYSSNKDVAKSFDFTKNLYLYELYKSNSLLIKEQEINKIVTTYNQRQKEKSI